MTSAAMKRPMKKGAALLNIRRSKSCYDAASGCEDCSLDRFEPSEPFPYSIELFVVDHIHASPAFLLEGYKARLLEHAKMSACRRPGPAEAPRDLARGHLSAAQHEHQQYVTPRRV